MSQNAARLTAIVISGLLRFTVAGPESSLLPLELLGNTPPCAQACVATFVRQQLSSCADSSSLNCLCEARSANGYTLGEGALSCIYDVCPDLDLEQHSGVYQICGNDPSAAPESHFTLIAPLATAPAATASVFFDAQSTSVAAVPTSPSTSFTKSSTRVSHVSRKTTLLSHTSRNTTTTTTTSNPRTTTTATITSTSSSMSSLLFDTSSPPAPLTPTWSTTSSLPTFTQNGAAASPTAAASHAVLGRGQVAGIAVAGAVVAIAVAALLALIFCGRRAGEQSRRSNGHMTAAGQGGPQDPERGGSGDGFADVKPETPLITQRAAPPIFLQEGNKAHQFLGLPAAPNQHRQSWWNKFGRGSSKPPPMPALPKQEVGVARYLTPTTGGVSSEPSPKSVASYHTTSQLLPEKPAYRPVGRQVYEKRLSDETAQNQPFPLAAGVGLRVIAATPEPKQERRLSRGWPQADTSQQALQGAPSLGGPVMKSKLSDPFIARTNEQQGHNAGLMPAFRASRAELPRILTSQQDAGKNLTDQSHANQQIRSQQGVPNFRSLVNPQAASNDPSQPPQIPSAQPFSPLTPGFAATPVAPQELDGQQQQGSIMNRPRGNTSPFFSSQQSQYFAYKQPARDRTKRKLRPETHYTTSSETEFEDDDPSPVSAHDNQPQVYQPQNTPRTHISIGGVAELPGLSPVAESPASKKTPPSGMFGFTKTPSPRFRPSPMTPGDGNDSDDDNDVHGTPLSKIRYPIIPGSGESPKHEVRHVDIAMGIPREAKAIQFSQLRLPAPTMIRRVSDGASGSDSLYDTDSDIEQVDPQYQGPKLEPSPLRPSKPADGNLRGTAQQQRAEKSEAAEVPASNPHIAKFRDAASRLAASSAGLRGPENSLGNWPVQPVRPILKNTQIPAPVGAPAFAGSQPSTPIDDTAMSPNSEVVHRLPAQTSLAATSVGGPPAAPSARFSRGVNPAEASGRVLIPPSTTQNPKAPILSPTQIPAPIKALSSHQESYSAALPHAKTQERQQAPDPATSNLPFQMYGQQGFQPGYHRREPSAIFTGLPPAAPAQRQVSAAYAPDAIPAYQGPKISAGPARHSKAPIRKTDQEREVRLNMQRLRSREQERRREIELEAEDLKWNVERSVRALRG